MLKQLISLLLSKFFSKQESALVGHQAMPHDGGTTIATTPTVVGSNWTTVASFTAPSDGYCFARIRPSAIFGFVQISAGEGINAVAATNTANEGQWVHLTLAMRKGALAKVQVSNADNIVVKFFSIIGGGYKLFKKYSLFGGAICLKSLLACLQRSSWRVNGKLFKHGAIQKIAALNYSLLQERTTILFLPQTVLSRSSCARILKGTVLALSRKEEATAKNAQELMRQTYLDGTRHSSLFKKELRSNFLPPFLAPLQNVYFCRTKTNLIVGGASC